VGALSTHAEGPSIPQEENSAEEHSLYGGEVLLQYQPRAHRYYAVVKGRRYAVPSVTTVLGVLDKPALIPWAINQAIEFIRPAIAPGVEHAESYLEEVYSRAKKEAGRRRSEAAERGTLVHEALSNDGGGGRLDVLDLASRAKIEVAQRWIKENVSTWSCQERPVYSRRHRFSGRLDGVAVVRDLGEVVLDFKTGKGIYPEFRFQTAAYAYALNEEGYANIPIETRVCLHLQEDKVVPHIYTRASLRQDFNAFLAALRLHRRLREISQEEKLVQKRQKEGLTD
jgi:hypothetical protein